MPHDHARGPSPRTGRTLPPEALAGLREAFTGEVTTRLPRLLALLDGPPGHHPGPDALRDAHALGSSAVVVGANDASLTARALEAELGGAADQAVVQRLVRELADRLGAWVPRVTPVPVAVVVVDDSPVQRRFLRAAVEAEGDFTVVGEAGNGREAVALVQRLRPAAVLMDLDLPVMSGIEAIEQIMSSHATPILVYSAFVAGSNSENALEALAAGAVDVLAKPAPDDTGTLDEYAAVLRLKLRVAARVRVITHPRGRLRSQGLTGTAPSLGSATPRRPLAPAVERCPEGRDAVRLIAVGASTGGPQALLTPTTNAL